MAKERTLSIIKPDGVKKNVIGEVLRRFEKEGFAIVAMKMIWMDQKQAEGFYEVHKARPFFKDLVAFMTSGPVVVMALEGDNIIARNREVMGATDPAKAAPGTIRKLYASDIQCNIVHGSDSPETAQREVAYFFKESEIVSN